MTGGEVAVLPPVPEGAVVVRTAQGVRSLWLADRQAHIAPFGRYLVVYDSELRVLALCTDLAALQRYLEGRGD